MNPIFDSEELNVLGAALDRIVPADDYPCATELGCIDFIESYLRANSDQIVIYKSGIKLLSDIGFGSATVAEQDDLLLELEGHSFVQLLIRQAMEGYYSDPGNGGNRDSKSWEMVGFKVKG